MTAEATGAMVGNPPSSHDYGNNCWRRMRAWRRWQTAVTERGAERGLDVPELRALGVYPRQRPFSAETVRRTGLRPST